MSGSRFQATRSDSSLRSEGRSYSTLVLSTAKKGASLSAIFLSLLLAAYLSVLHRKIEALESALIGLSRDTISLQDFAWVYNGARVVPKLTSPSVPTSNQPGNSPYKAMDEDLRPGRCWPFRGSMGQLGIQFVSPLKLSHITIDHIPKEVAMHMQNAPRDIMVWGFNASTTKVSPVHGHSSVDDRDSPPLRDKGYTFTPVANLTYNIHSPTHIQTFPIATFPGADGAHEGVVVEFLSNWGWETTCIYRVRIHGEIEKK